MKESLRTESVLKASGVAILGATIFFALLATALLFYGAYDPFGQMLSELGIGETGFIFNVALIICGLFSIPFFCTQIFGKPFLSQAASIMAIASMLFLAGIGLFPLSSYDAHLFTAAMFFVSVAFAIMLYSMHEIAFAALAKKRRGMLFWKGIIFCILGFFVAEFSFFFVFISTTPVNQKLAVALIIAWMVAKILLEVEREAIPKKEAR